MVSYRGIPFFTSRVVENYGMMRPRWAPPAVLALSFAHGVLALLQLASILWLVDLPLLATVAYCAWRWGFARSFGVRLLAVLYVALAGLVAGLGLFVAQSLVLIAAAGALWFAAFAAWGARYLPIYWNARADGRPG